MIALLPLRMWAAEGMAVRMAHGEIAAAAGASHMDSMPEDCPMAAKAKAGSSEEAPQAAGHCVACHLCAASACLPQTALGQKPAPAGPPAFSSPRFASADAPRDLRPPIS